jgi:phosphoribosylamine--glycine ligase / phosphoribosylformylglycinamidine cyclo-ligase
VLVYPWYLPINGYFGIKRMTATAENILIVGSGGREHALGFRLAGPGRNLFFAPGNGGTEEFGTNVDIASGDIDGLVRFAVDGEIDFTVVGPEDPLAHGIVGAFGDVRKEIMGPTSDAARLESSKAIATHFMLSHNIPSPDCVTFTDYEAALRFIDVPPWPVVIKASGLASGKGVVVPDTHDEAVAAIRAMLVEKKFGEAGREIVIQERLSGPEISVFAFCDGKTAVPIMVPIQDHKRLKEGDLGPNTGGMGTYGPVPFVSPELMEEIHQTILQPTVDGMRVDGYPFKGILFAGIMLTNQGPKVLEYNVRFGDPETQTLMMLLSENTDLLSILRASARGTLGNTKVHFRDGYAACIVLAAEGYPDHAKHGAVIRMPRVVPPGVQIFHAGTMMRDGQLVVSGGRVLGVTARGRSVGEAVQMAKQAIGGDSGVLFDGMQYRRDIAWQSRKT